MMLLGREGAMRNAVRNAPLKFQSALKQWACFMFRSWQYQPTEHDVRMRESVRAGWCWWWVTRQRWRNECKPSTVGYKT